ncbi:hypothetical protein GCM10010218_49750 [Streptomyces mashuensis]|uniref:DUF4232 domain-containing protein n=1 Tax=Streptomyces mashuensis TaxID=33904 RepID=A0A919B661_9ACTN|nr:hypothetical protein [Streptomyces mashuensis]GHF62330.1 hypothetical protein GCM10010218_49750 [Streptomyces mashuensis]
MSHNGHHGHPEREHEREQEWERPGDGRDPMDGAALRRLLQGAVGDLEPAPDALERLRQAVPARRARRRQVAVGAAAAVILGATAVPVLIRVATTGATEGGHSANAASSHQRTHEITDGRQDAGGPGAPGMRPIGPDGRTHSEQEKGERGRRTTTTPGPASPSSGTPGTPPTAAPTLVASSPSCDRNQLGQGTGTVGTADKDGRIYGAFRVVNVSHSVCAVSGSGVVAARPQGNAESSRLTVIDHTPGDAAVGLPDPATEPSQVILQPGQAYEIKFAWIPAADGGPSGCAKTTAPTPSAAPSQGAPAGAAPQAPGEQQTQQPAPDNATAAKPTASVVLTHTPDVGQPQAADATLPDACAGTIYRTGPLAAQPSQ